MVTAVNFSSDRAKISAPASVRFYESCVWGASEVTRVKCAELATQIKD
ncbi:hypothetical protein Ab1vBOLIVR4_gp34 [Agrobacterium phage OLIVR4]|nr:hypothetical protein Ab1vBOLIVR4_gp34 [Agrobacterium phage OLIVR4]